MANECDTTPPDPRVLVVGGLGDEMAVIEEVAGALGGRIALAATGGEALREAARVPPNAVLLGPAIPDLPPGEACLALRSALPGRHLPALFLLPAPQAGELAAVFEIEDSDYVALPISPPVLRGRLANQLKTAGLVEVHDRHLRDLEAMARDLRRNERRFKDIAEAASEWFWEMDAELRMRYLSDRFFEISGSSPDRIYGKTRVQIAGPAQVAREPEKWRQHLAMLDARQPFRDFEYTVVPEGTRPLHIRISGTPIFDEDGRFAGYRGTGCDVTAQREAELELRRLAVTDGLTGVFNRRHFLELSETEFARSRRYAHPLSVLILDADHFKSINDTYGHATGDRVLQALASTARDRLRGLDFLGRLGGEEFAVALPETGEDGVQAVGERLRLAIAEVRLELDGQALGFSVSGGTATLRPDDPDLAELLRRADLALYTAKEAGRNRVVPG